MSGKKALSTTWGCKQAQAPFLNLVEAGGIGGLLVINLLHNKRLIGILNVAKEEI